MSCRIMKHTAYYILLKDVPSPNQENDTFTVRIQKSNRLSTIDWDSIKQYVSEVRDRKVNANREYLRGTENF
jgi:hypothetical protein